MNSAYSGDSGPNQADSEGVGAVRSIVLEYEDTLHILSRLIAYVDRIR